MNPKTINAIRDLALEFESSNLEVAYELMEIAYNKRPSGPFIKRKYLEYKKGWMLFQNLSKKIGLYLWLSQVRSQLFLLGFAAIQK